MSRLRAGMIVGLAMALGVSMSAVPAMAADPAPAASKAPVAKKKRVRAPKPPRKIIVNGISSGVLRLPVITIWECPGGAMGGCNPVGELKHGTPAMRMKFEKARGHKWAYIESDTLKGWIRKDLIKNAPTQ